MFDANLFIKNNLIKGLNSGSFAPEQVNIYTFNYLQKGTITQETFDVINDAVDAYVEEQAKLAEQARMAEEQAEA